MSWSADEIDRVCGVALAVLGAPYALGGVGEDGKWHAQGKPDHTQDPRSTGTDCSGLARWIIAQGLGVGGKRIVMPHGCIAQLKFCTPVSGEPLVLDLGFADLRNSDGAPDHVVIKINDTQVIEARGKPFSKVILRPVAAWDAQKGFMGWWSIPGIRTGR